MKLANILRWGLLVPVGAVLAAYLIAVAINWRDRPPSADVLRLQRVLASRAPVAASDNGFIYMFGFDAASGHDPQEEGERRARWLLEFNQGHASLGADPLRRGIHFWDSVAPEVARVFDACAPDHHDECPAAFAKAPPPGSWSETDRLQLERYRVLVTRHGWQEIVPTDISAPLPAYSGPIHGQRLQFLALRGADAATVREALEADLAFWRGMLASSSTLIAKMIAVAGLRNHFYYGNLLLRGVERADAAAIPAGWRQPITRQESSMESVMAGELEFMSGLNRQFLHESEVGSDWLDDTDSDPLRSPALRFIARPLYQAQDEINHAAAVYVATADAFAVPVERFPDAAKQLKQRPVIDPFPSRLYNVVGDFYRSRGSLEFSEYGLRVGVVEAWRRAALLTADSRARGVSPAQMSAELERATLRNPFGGAAFAWEATRGEVVYRGTEKNQWRVQQYLC